MKLKDFDYHLPQNLISQKPIKPRDHSRLLVFNKKTKDIAHKKFKDIVDFLNKGDILVLNNSRVLSARLIGKKAETGGKIEVFLLKKVSNKKWQCLIGGRGAKKDLVIVFNSSFFGRIILDNNDGTFIVEFNQGGKTFMETVEKVGDTPLPPYIKRDSGASRGDKEYYQTIYADKKKTGSVAAPTAGMHFTPKLLEKIRRKGVKIRYITLHVGLGTFYPVKVEEIKKHKMHAEHFEISKSVVDDIKKTKEKGGRVIAVGTTTARTLEYFYKHQDSNSGWTDIFIYPPFKFRAVDGLITNFHLPKSTLLMLVSALVGRSNVMNIYKIAIRKKYKFFSYGDAMFLS